MGAQVLVDSEALLALAEAIRLKGEQDERLAEAINRQSERDERLIRALETIAHNESRKLQQVAQQKARQESKIQGPVSDSDVAQVQARLAKHRRK